MTHTQRFIIFFSLFCSILSWHSTYSQISEFDWIKGDQPYLKVVVQEDGIYKLTGEQVMANGWNPGTFQSENLQLFYRGKEVSIQLNDGGDTSFDKQDFLQFFGKKNDGSTDSLLYRNAERANPYYSLYSDESAYFLTIGTTPGKRISTTNVPSGLRIEPETYHLEQQLTVFTDEFSFNNDIGLVPLLQQSYFEFGESQTGKYITSDSTATLTIPLKNRVQVPDYQPKTTFRINGRSRIPHQLQVVINTSEAVSLEVQPFGFVDKTVSINESSVKNGQFQLTLTSTSTQKRELDWYSFTFLKTIFPQKTLMGGLSEKYFYLHPTTEKFQTVSLTDLPVSALVWNVADAQNPVITQKTNDHYATGVSAGQTILFATATTKNVTAVSAVSFFKKPSKSTDYLIITHATLLPSANDYATYRKSAAGGGYEPLIVTTQEIYDAYNYGERSPVALRKFCEYMLAAASPKQLLLLGRGVSFPDELREATYENLVPTIGYPGSDLLITSGLNDFPRDVPAISTGRLNVTSNTEVRAYLEKVKTFEAIKQPEEWQKKVLHLSGGKSASELSSLKSILRNVQPTAEGGLLGGEVKVIAKKTDVEVEPVDISQEVNDGVGMITFAGHGSANVIDLNIGYVSPPQNGFANEGKYPVMFFNGCGVGNVFYRYNPLSTDWLLTPKKGAIGVFANSFWSYAYPTQRYLDVLYEKMFSDPATVNLTLGEIQQAVSKSLTSEIANDYIKANIHQMILQGDPALRIFPISKSDYEVTDKTIFISSKNESQVIAQNDSVRIGIILKNKGRFEKGQRLTISVNQEYSNAAPTEISRQFPAVSLKDTLFITVKKETSLTELTVNIDPKNEITELNKLNNTGKLVFNDWSQIGQKTSFPENILPDRLPPVLKVRVNGKLLTNDELIPAKATVQVELDDNNPFDKTNLAYVQLFLKSCKTCDFKLIELNNKTFKIDNVLIINSLLDNLTVGTYTLLVTGQDAAENKAIPYQIDFRVTDIREASQLLIFPNPGDNFVQIRYFVIDYVTPPSGKLVIFNATGQQVAEQVVTPSVGENSYFYDTTILPAGRYFVKISLDAGQETLTQIFIKR